MIILPAIDLYGGCAVRLYKGDYDNMTVYSRQPEIVAKTFRDCGAEYIHIVDLEGARDGTTPNLELIRNIAASAGCAIEVGGGIRSMETTDAYLSAGVNRVILGTAAVKDRKFLTEAVKRWGSKIAVSVDVKNGFVAVKGWTELSELSCGEFFRQLQSLGVSTAVCTDISKDGAMGGTNLELYQELREKYSVDIIASGGVSSMDDVLALRKMGLYGAIIGKAYYVGAIDLREAIEAAK